MEAIANNTQLHPTCPQEFFIFNSPSFIVLKIVEELSHVELFRSVLIDKAKPETEIFNYFAKVSDLRLSSSVV